MSADGPVRVLLIDDDEDDQVLTRDLLQEIEPGRYALDWLADYDAALDSIAACEHDVYLLDYRLGERDGLELLRTALNRGCRAPIIVLTGLGDREVDLAASRAGAADYLVKGQITPVLLERAIRLALERRRFEQERAARIEAEATLRARDDVLAAASHDLRTPLTVISSVAQLLQRHLARETQLDRQRIVDGVQRIAASSRRMADQLDDLLDAARLQAGRPLELRRQPTDLVALARQVAAALQQTTDRHTIALETDAPDLVGIWDETRLARVLDNLLSNAIKYSPTGGPVTLAIRRATPPDPPAAVLSVRDRGVGIPAADLPRIFEHFHRGTNVTGIITGTGLGLAGAREIVQQHGGRLDLESREGRGTTVTLTLPLDPSDQP